MSAEIRWEDPPSEAAAPGRRGKFEAVAAALRAKPGDWARIHEAKSRESAANWAGRVQNGKVPAFVVEDGTFEVRSLDGVVWGKFVEDYGDDDED